MGLLLLISGVLSADASIALRTQAAPVEAVLLDARGTVFIKQNRKRVAVGKGRELIAGDVLLVPEDSEVLILYRTGRHARIQGPARSEIAGSTGKQSASNRSQNGEWTNRLAAAFSRAHADGLSTTVGGVRKVALLTLFSPSEFGGTPEAFQLAWNMHGHPGGISIADRLRIRIFSGKRILLTRNVDPLAADAKPIRFDLSAQRELKNQPEEFELELQFFSTDEFGEDQPLGTAHRSRFRLARQAAETALKKELKQLEAAHPERTVFDSDLDSVLALARVETYLAHDFRGEAMVEIVSQLKTHPKNKFWERMLESCRSPSPNHSAAEKPAE